MIEKTLSAEDSALFKQTVGKVKKIATNTLLLTKGERPKPYPKPAVFGDTNNFEGDIDGIESLSHEDSLNFIAPGLQKKVLRRLRNGYFGLDAMIDLHGLSSQNAQHKLLQFLAMSVGRGFRCVHIVHGKGHHSPDNLPILKNNINIWLRQHKMVQAFCSTLPKDGGTGAVFVLLKRLKK